MNALTGWDILQMEGPCDLSYLDSMSPEALEASFLEAAERSSLIAMVLLRTVAQMLSHESDLTQVYEWLQCEVSKRQKINERAAL